MKYSTIPQKLVIFFLVFLLTACSSGTGAPEAPAAPTQPPPAAAPTEPSPTATAEPTQAPAPTLPPGEFAPLSAADCQQIQGQIAGALGVPFTFSVASFTTVSGRNGTGCKIQAAGTQVDFGKSYGEIVGLTVQTFQDWQPDNNEAADSPLGSLIGLRSGNKFMLADLSWSPAPGVNCPPDQPISACQVSPEQTLITVTLNAAIDLVAAAQPPAAAAPQASLTPEITPTNPSAFATDQVIRFDTEPMAVSLDGSVSSGSFDRYVFDVLGGEYLDIRLSSLQQTAGFKLLNAAGKAMPGTENGRALYYSDRNMTAGSYSLIVTSLQGRADYTLKINTSQKGPVATAAPTSTTTTSGAYQPLPAAECKQIKKLLESALNVGFSRSEGPFNVSGSAKGMACILSASGDGTDFESIPAITSALKSVLDDWTEDPAFAADSPTSSYVGIRRGLELMLISLSWQPSPDANCPQDKPISECDLKPEQKLYTIYIQVATQ